MDIKLDLVNRSDDANDVDIVIFAQPASSPQAPPVVWQSIPHFKPGDHRGFVFPAGVAGGESYGNADPRIWIGVASGMDVGQVMNPDAISGITELSLAGIAGADIVMTGSGSDSRPFRFALANVITA
jgi:hypothetical protein